MTSRIRASVIFTWNPFILLNVFTVVYSTSSRTNSTVRGRSDVNAIQALLLFNIGNSELTAGELRSRGYYLGSNVSYNVKKLVDLGFINHQRSRIDRRSVRISLTETGQDIAETVAKLYERHIASIDKVGGIGTDEFTQMNKLLQRLDRFWNDSIMYRL